MDAKQWRLFLGIPQTETSDRSRDDRLGAARSAATAEASANDFSLADALGLEPHHGAVSAYEKLLSSSGSELPADESWQTALALCTKALSLSGVGDFDAATAACDELLKICAESSIPHSLGMEGLAKHLKWQIGQRVAYGGDAEDRFQAVLASLGSDQGAIVDGLVTKGLVEKGVALLGSSSDEAAQQALDSASQRLAGTGAEELRYWATRTLLDKSLTLREDDRAEEALRLVDRALDWLADEDHAVQSSLPLRTMLLKATLVDEMGRAGEAFRAFNEVDRIAGAKEVPDEDSLTVEARTCMNAILLRVTLLLHPNPGTTESEDIQPWSERELPTRLEAIGLYKQAAEALSTRQPAEAVKFSTRMLKRAPSSIARVRIEAHWIRAMARLKVDQYDQRYDQRLVERDISQALGLLTRFESATLHAIRILAGLTGRLGSERVLQLIQDSPSSKLLVLLRLSLERELGREPSVPAEAEGLVDAVAEEVVVCREALGSTKDVPHPEPDDAATGAAADPTPRPSARRKRSAKTRRRPRRR